MSDWKAEMLAEARDFYVRLVIARGDLRWWQWRQRRCFDTLANEFAALYKQIDAMSEDEVAMWLATAAA